MRFVNGFMCVVLIAFALVHYSDAGVDAWVPIYGIPAAWAGLAARCPARLARPAAALLLGLTLALASIGSWWLWPREDGFWQRDVWWHSDTAREGVGMMIVTLSLVLVAIATLGARPDDDTDTAPRPTSSDLDE